MTKTLILFLTTIIAICILSALLIYTSKLPPTTDNSPATLTNSEVTPSAPQSFTTKTLATGLDTPWSLAFLPDNSILVTERPGRLRLIDKNGKLLLSPIAKIKDVVESSEGGLLGVAIHPNFPTNKYVYLYYTYEITGDDTRNKVVRYKLTNNKLTDETLITDRIPGSILHNGGRIKFGPDGFLYITTGDAQLPSLAQTRTSLAGKILRVTENGDPAPNNPFSTRVFSYGHRNPQGITWDKDGNLWETEHGNNAADELNLILPGNNYGWPTIKGDEEKAGMITPLLQSGTTTWAPGDIVYLNNSLYFTGLKANGLFKVDLKNNKVTNLKKYFDEEFGRLRDVVVGPNKMLYISTSNKDSRGNPSADDDKIIIINPNKL